MTSDDTAKAYAKAKLGQRLIPGRRPGILVVDLTHGFTDSASSLGGDLDQVVASTRELLDVARERGLPIIFTTIAYEPHLKDCGPWLQKGRGLAELLIGTQWVEVDDRLGARPDEPVIVKKGASAFFGTNLTAVLTSQGVDTVVLCGASTSGCIRATAVDLIQYGYPSLVPRECVGDRAKEPHEANLLDIDAKYADVVSLEETLTYLDSVSGNGGAVVSHV